ncbi:hypothetical protein [Paenibacillus solani]|uniref:hypothetical protein n=1 Tax=Paenibacillus solani TaxID=1705565 RepID=UPI003D2A3489
MVCLTVTIPCFLIELFIEPFIELLFMKLSPSLSPPHDEEGCHAPHQRSGRIDSGEAKWSPLLPNFYIDNVIHEIRKQQRSEERYVCGASHWSVSLERLIASSIQF